MVLHKEIMGELLMRLNETVVVVVVVVVTVVVVVVAVVVTFQVHGKCENKPTVRVHP